MIPTLRSYQEDIIRQIVKAKKQDGFNFPTVVAPTGSGKTVMFAFLAQSAMKKGKRVLILVHRIEILQQTMEALFKFGVQAGAIAPGKPMTDELIQVAMIQTISHKLEQILPPDMIIIDEGHHCVSNSYMKIMKKYPDVFKSLWTATPERGDGSGLIEAGSDTMIGGPTTKWLVAEGFLSRPRIFVGPEVRKEKKPKYHIKRGDYDKEEQFQEKKARVYVGNVIQHYRQHLNGLPTVCFCVSVEHAKMMEDEFKAAGYRSMTVHGGMKKPERDKAIQGLATGEVQVLTACDVISEGTDVPVIAGAILLRRTKSLGLFLQQTGRSLRPIYKEGMPIDTKEQRLAAQAAGIKPYSVILDHAGNVHEHGLVLAEREWSLYSVKRSKRDKIDPPETTVCPQCGGVFPGRKNTCPDCGFDIETDRLHDDGKRTPEEIEGVLREVLDEQHTQQEILAMRDQAFQIQQMDPAARQKAMLANLHRHGKSDRMKGLAKAVNFSDKWTETMYSRLIGHK